MDEELLPYDLPLMNCAQCLKAMTPKRCADTAREFGLRVFAARVAGRPYCSHCVDDSPHRIRSRDQLARYDRRRAGVTPIDDESPWQSKVIREAEDAE